MGSRAEWLHFEVNWSIVVYFDVGRVFVAIPMNGWQPTDFIEVAFLNLSRRNILI